MVTNHTPQTKAHLNNKKKVYEDALQLAQLIYDVFQEAQIDAIVCGDMNENEGKE